MNKILNKFDLHFKTTPKRRMTGKQASIQSFNLLGAWDVVFIRSWESGYDGYDGKAVTEIHLCGQRINPRTGEFGMTKWVVDE